MKLRTKMFIEFLSTIIFASSLVGIIVSMLIISSERSSAEKILALKTREAALMISNHLESYKSNVDRVALFVESLLGASATQDNTQKSLDQLLASISPPAQAGFIMTFEETNAPSAAIYTWINGKIQKNELSVTEEEQYVRLLRPLLVSEQSSLFGSNLISAPTKKTQNSALYIRALRLNGRVTGAVGAVIDIEPLMVILSNLNAAPESEAMLFSPEGIIAATNPTTTATPNTELKAFWETLKPGENLSFYSPVPKRILQAFYTLEPIALSSTKTHWSLLLSTPGYEVLTNALTLIRLLVVYFGLAVAAIAGAMIFLIQKRVKSIIVITKRLESFSNLDFRSDKSKQWIASLSDEIGDMARSLGGLQSNLVGMLASISDESNTFMQSSQNLAALSQETVTSTQKVSVSVQNATALSASNMSSLENARIKATEVARASLSTAQTSQESAKTAGTTLSIGKEVLEEVQGVVLRIENVGVKSNESRETLQRVSQSVSAITRFVSTITGIADQTNLLALNAAIEAARAGDAGRGFAVVADEVRKLAEESSLASKEIEKLINTLQNESLSADTTTQEMNAILSETIQIANNAGEKLNKSITQIDILGSVIQNIAATAEQQATLSDEMTNMVNQVTQHTLNVSESLNMIKDSTEETSKGSTQVAQEAQAMTFGVDRLRELVERFVLDSPDTRELP